MWSTRIEATPALAPSTDGRNSGNIKPPEEPKTAPETPKLSKEGLEKLLANPNLTEAQRRGYRAILAKIGVKP